MSDWRRKNPATFVLAQGETISVRMRGRKCRVACGAGRLWATAPRSREDSILGPGEEVTLQGRGLLVIQAMRDATVRLETRVAAERADRPVDAARLAPMPTRAPTILPY